MAWLQRGYEKDFAERCFKQIEGFGEYGFPESHAAVLRAAGLCLLLVQGLLSRRLLRGDPELPADGLLPAGAAGPRRRDHGVEITRSSTSIFPTGTARWRKRPSIRRRIARAACRDARRHQDLPCRPARFSADQGTFRRSAWSSSSPGAATAMNRYAMSGCAPASTSTRSSGWPQADAFRSLGLDRREALWAVRALDGKSAAERLPLFDRPDDPPARQ